MSHVWKKRAIESIARRIVRAIAATCLAAVGLGGVLIFATSSPAAAATTTLSSPTTLSGNQTLSSTGLNVSGAGVTATFDLQETLTWTQPAKVTTSFDPNLVRQGRTPDPTDSYATAGAGNMVLTWSLDNLQVSWDGIGPLSLGSPSFSASGACNLAASGPNYDCSLSSSQIPLLDTYPLPGPYVKLGLGGDVTITPQGLATMRQAVFGGINDGTASLTLSETPVTDTLAIPCTVGAGDDLSYALGSLSVTDGVTVATNLVFDVGAEFPNPFPPFNEIDISFATPSIPLSTTTSSITMGGPGATFDFGNVLANNVPPTVNAGGPYSGNEGLPVTFNGTGSSSICGFPTLVWNLSDGGVAYGPQPQHTFPGSGTYSGLLTATDTTGLSTTTTFSVSITNLPPVVDAGPDTTSAWGIPVAFNGSATDPGIADQATLTYSWDFGDGSPSATGGASVLHPYATPGDYTATLTSCDQYVACASATRIVHVIKRNTTLAYTGDTSGIFNTPATLSGSLVDQFGQAVNGRMVTFEVGTDGPFSALTNASGSATTSYSPTLAAGSYSVTGSFTGDGLYNASSSSNTFSVAKKATSTTYTGATSGGPNKTIALSAVLKDATGNPLAGRTITFQLGAQSVSAITNASGVASSTLKLAQKNGTYTVTATYDPTATPPDAAFYLGSSQATVFLLQVK